MTPICEGDLRFRTKLFSGILHAPGEQKFDQIIGADPSPSFQFKNNNISLPKKPLGLALLCKNAPLALCCCWQTLSPTDCCRRRARGEQSSSLHVRLSHCYTIIIMWHWRPDGIYWRHNMYARERGVRAAPSAAKIPCTHTIGYERTPSPYTPHADTQPGR